jgi:hypothetical protein
MASREAKKHRLIEIYNYASHFGLGRCIDVGKLIINVSYK